MNRRPSGAILRSVRLATALFLAAIGIPAQHAAGQGAALPSGASPGASAWSTGMHSSVRLLDAGPDAGSARAWRAGVEVRLDPHFKTYWRTPGDSGLPPVFDWSRSQNVASAEVLWPAPTRFEDTAGSSIGYVGDTVFPVRVTLADPRKPAVLDLKLDYAVCEKVCIPARADARITLSPQGLSTPHGLTVMEAESRVPRPAALGASDAPAIRSVRATTEGTALIVEALVPDTTGIVDLFTEGPDLWVFGAPLAMATVPHAAGVRLLTYRVKVEERPAKDAPLAALPLKITMTAASEAIETVVKLDGSGAAP